MWAHDCTYWQGTTHQIHTVSGHFASTGRQTVSYPTERNEHFKKDAIQLHMHVMIEMFLDLTSSCNVFVLQKLLSSHKIQSTNTRKKQRSSPKTIIASGLREIHLPAEKQMFVWNQNRIRGRKLKPGPAEQVGRGTHRSSRLPKSKGRAENCLLAPSENTNLMDQARLTFSFFHRRQRLDNKALLLVNKVH